MNRNVCIRSVGLHIQRHPNAFIICTNLAGWLMMSGAPLFTRLLHPVAFLVSEPQDSLALIAGKLMSTAALEESLGIMRHR